MTLTDDYILEHAITTRGGTRLVPDRDGIPDRIERDLTRRYGRPQTIDRGETAYWTIDDYDAIERATT